MDGFTTPYTFSSLPIIFGIELELSFLIGSLAVLRL